MKYILVVINCLLLVVSCAKSPTEKIVEKPVEKLVEKTIEVPIAQWGLEFKFTPISKASAFEQNLSKAVAFIQDIDGSDATGFFISEDGLFLTNEHVFSRKTCSVERCTGRKIIRDFTPNGDFEVFEHYDVIAQDGQNRLDFTLLQVKLKPGQKVPYLKLAAINAPIFKELEKNDLILIGHPFRASLQVSQAKYNDVNNDDFVLDSIGVQGNSGSPLIDKQSGLVVGLYHGSNWNQSTINKNYGTIYHDGLATDIRSIRRVLNKLFNITEDPKSYSVSTFPQINAPKINEVLPQEKIVTHFAEPTKLSSDTFLFQNLGTETETKGLAYLIENFFKSSQQKSELENFIDSLVFIDLARDATLKLTKEQIDNITNSSINEDNPINALTKLKVHQELLSTEDCVKQVDSGKLNLINLKNISYYCLSNKNNKGELLINLVEDHFAEQNIDFKKEQSCLKVANTLIRQLVTQRTVLTNEEKEKILKLLELISINTSNLYTAFSSEGLYTLIQRDPTLITKGSFKNVF
ncbi:MAG: trypsin-like peptidase domain-containing protein [Deltaproteobacteria bacterium]|nr:trypsin-like peptidase domain-containing protein [Deltaproteobacteria bacterium]